MALHICDFMDHQKVIGVMVERMNGYLSEIPNNRGYWSNYCSSLVSLILNCANILAKTSTALKPVLTTDVEMGAEKYAVYQYKLYISPVLDRFEYQCNIDRGEVDHWPFEFLHPSKSHVKVDKEIYKHIAKRSTIQMVMFM